MKYIAEIGVNHEGSLEKAKELIVLAKTGGADAVKFQSYKACAGGMASSMPEEIGEGRKSRYRLGTKTNTKERQEKKQN